MRKIIYSLVLCACTLLIVTGCNDDNDVFDKSAAERLAEAQTKALLALQNVPNGWIMQYYSDTASSGGFTMLAKFDSEMNVSIAGEEAIVGSHEIAVSKYGLIGDRGPVLSFVTYNKIFHLFSDPQSDGLGMQGDYEFLILEASDNKIVMEGKKRNARIVMTPLSQSETWDSYLNKVDKINTEFMNASPLKWTMYLGKEGMLDTLQISIDKRRAMTIIRTFILDETTTDQPQLIGTKDTETLKTSYIITPEGLETYSPFVIAEKDTIYKFTWNEQKELMESTNAYIEPIKMRPLEIFSISEDSWLVDTLTMSEEFASYYVVAEKAVRAKSNRDDYKLYMGFSYVSFYEQPIIYFTSVSASQGLLFMKYTLTGTDNIRIQFSDFYNQEGYDTYRIAEFKALIDYIGKVRMRVEVDNEFNPSEFKFYSTRGDREYLFSIKKIGGNGLFVLED